MQMNRENQKIAQDKIKSYPGSNDDSHYLSGIILKKARKEVKKNSQGEAIFCFICKRCGILYSKYYSKSDRSCNDAEYTQKNISGSVPYQSSVTKSFKKQ